VRYFSFVLVGMVALCCSSASGQSLIGVNGGSGGGFASPGAFLTIDQTTGAGTVLGTPLSGLGLTGVAVDSLGRVFASSGTTESATNGPRLIQIDPATGALIADVGRLQTAGGDDCYVGDLSFQPGTRVLFGILGNQGSVPRCGVSLGGGVGGYLLTIDTTTAQVTVIGRDPSLGNSNGGLAFAPDGTLYFTPCWSESGFIHTLNPATAAIITSTAFLEANTCYMGLAVRPTDGTIFASYDNENDDNRIFTLDPVTGAREVVGLPGNYLVHDLAFLGPVIPGEGAVGTIIEIRGKGFGAKKGKVYLGTVALKVLVWEDEIIQCLINKPLSPSAYDVTIQPKGAVGTSFKKAFSVDAPRIGSVSPNHGGQGTEVTISGDFFGTSKGKVTLGGKNCKVLTWEMDPSTGKSTILILIPKGLGPGTYNLTVANKVDSDTMEGVITVP
jgi:hypothetical protein